MCASCRVLSRLHHILSWVQMLLHSPQTLYSCCCADVHQTVLWSKIGFKSFLQISTNNCYFESSKCPLPALCDLTTVCFISIMNCMQHSQHIFSLYCCDYLLLTFLCVKQTVGAIKLNWLCKACLKSVPTNSKDV
jgi:hypothetical protein